MIERPATRAESSYGWGVGHIRINNEAYRRRGLAAVSTTPAELEAALHRALAAPRERPQDVSSWPHCADAVLDLV